MQLDADEDGEPFFKPPAIASAPIRQDEGQHASEDQPQQTPVDSSQLLGEDETERAAAATETVDQEE